PQWGQTSGHNSYGDLGWAERYDISTADSSVTILGVIVAVGGSVQASPTASTGKLNVRVYDEGAKEGIPGASSASTVSGYPNTMLDEVQLPYAGLTINSFNAAVFNTPIQIADTFFAAAVLDAYAPTSTMDSLFIFLGIDGTRPSSDVFSSLTPTDTTVNVRNAALWNDNKWYDEATMNSTLLTHYAIFPIVIVKYNAIGINDGISKDALTFKGNYPNPASINTNIRISLKKAADVKVNVYDVTGKVILTHTYSNVATGATELPLNVSALANGSYIYTVESNGATIGSILQVAQ
ncbi:MAG: T9SS type A sorting domain-containing protein, partial [Bacteroidia bacterium]